MLLTKKQRKKEIARKQYPTGGGVINQSVMSSVSNLQTKYQRSSFGPLVNSTID